MDWFLYGEDFRHERVKCTYSKEIKIRSSEKSQYNIEPYTEPCQACKRAFFERKVYGF